MKFLLLLASFSSLGGCLHLDVDPCMIDSNAEMAYCRPTNPSKPRVDVDLKTNLKALNKFTCFSADDLAEIERALNQCH